jgi:RNA 2',3'-cyclic 3'-phosphodiesterase
MIDRWRCFVALPIGDELRGRLVDAVARWRDRPDLAGLRWSDPASWHVTLAFLGPTEPRAVPEIVSALAQVASIVHPGRVDAGGLGAFPSRRQARVAWYGLRDAEHRIGTLAGAIRLALKMAPEERFHPHLTLARAGRAPIDLRAWIEEESGPPGEVAIERVELLRSHLGRGPAQYEVLDSVRLGLSSHV